MGVAEPRRIVFLCSGGGGNLALVQAAISLGLLDAEIVTVLSDRESGANRVAERLGIAHRVVDFAGEEQSALRESLVHCHPDLIVTNVHRILKPAVVEAFRGRLINLHYSLLPAFGGAIGARPLQSALAHGCKLVGATVHWVDESVDGGRPIAQCAVPVGDDPASLDDLMNVVFRCGGLGLLASLRALLRGVGAGGQGRVLSVLGRSCLLAGPDDELPVVDDGHALWERVRAAVQ